MKKKVLITGGTGFLGSTFIKKYSQEYEFLIVSRQQVAGAIHPDNLTLKSIQDFKPEFLVHLAANSSVEITLSAVSEIIRSNIELPALVTELFMQAGGRKILNIGSYWEHMNNSIYSPNSLYAASKKAFEDLLQYYVDVKGAEAITLKIFDTYGKNDIRKKIFRLIYQAHKNKTPLELSGGEQLLSLVHSEDVADAFHQALSRKVNGHEFYLVKAFKTVKLKDLINEFCKINNLNPVLIWGIHPYGPRDFFKEVNVHEILPGWTPKILISDGLKDLYQD